MTSDPETTTASNPLPTLRVRGPAELLQAVPYLLGFHPTQSLVVIGLDAGQLVVTVRVDLADLALTEVLPDAVVALRRGGATEFVGAVYDDSAVPESNAGPLPWHGLAWALHDEAERLGCTVTDVLLVAGERWWSYLCASSECCPVDGRRLDELDSAVSAEATYAGLVALPDRAALAAVLDPSPDADRAGLTAPIQVAEQAAVDAVLAGNNGRIERSIKRALFAASRASDRVGWSGGPESVSDDDVVRYGVALCGYAVRDAVWMAIDDGRLDGRELWRELARRLPSPYDAAPLFLYGWRSWRAGNGALAGIAADRAVESDPGYSAADLLLAALARGVDPRQLPKLRLPRPA